MKRRFLHIFALNAVVSYDGPCLVRMAQQQFHGCFVSSPQSLQPSLGIPGEKHVEVIGKDLVGYSRSSMFVY